jgi:phosphinothricin acetyltransferase
MHRPGNTGTKPTSLSIGSPQLWAVRWPGWAALSPVSDRCVYGGVAENSIYMHPAHRNRGLGHELLDALIASSEAAGIWTVQTGIFPENTASLALHLRVGFRVIGRRERIGQLNGIWRDTLLLERRSLVVG